MTAQAARLQAILLDRAATHGDSVALWWQGSPITYAELAARVRRLAGCLAGVGRPGGRVAVLAWNCPEYIELIYAAPAAGRVLLPLNTRLAPAEWVQQLAATGVDLVVGDADLLADLQSHPGFADGVETVSLGTAWEDWLARATPAPLPPTAATDPAWILYTSGSTGRPKGAVLTHQSFLAGLRSAAMARPVAPDDRYFYPFPLFHVAAHNVLLQHLYGAAVVLAARFDAAATLQTCRDLGVTSMSLAPTMLGMLLAEASFTPADLRQVRSIGYGAAAMPQTLLQRLLAQTDVGLCQSYGMTELSGSVSFLTAEDHRAAARERPDLLQSVGRPLPTAEIRLVDDQGSACAVGEAGEILVRAEQVMQGYWRDPDATAAALLNGWLHTGDVGRFDADGYLYIVDRKKDMIITGGENVASREVEEVLRLHPAVTDCAVIGLPDARWGESIAAILVAAGEVPDDELATHCRGQLAGFKCPRRFARVDSLPLNAAGKVDKPALRARFAD